jgi:hypothetical protein
MGNRMCGLGRVGSDRTMLRTPLGSSVCGEVLPNGLVAVR